MKIFRFVQKLYETIAGVDKAWALQLLNQQRELLKSGIEVSAEVLNISLMPKPVGSLQQARLSIKLKKADGSFIYTPTKALVSKYNVPEKGQLLRIKYLPQDLSVIVLM